MKKIISIIYSIILILFFNSCDVLVKSIIDKHKASKKMTIENHAIPPEFGKNKSTLICILNASKNRDKALRRHIENNYNGDYIFILREELKSAAYSDKDLYRYFIDFNGADSVTHLIERGNTTKEVAGPILTSYYIYDRKIEKTYSSGFRSNYFGKMILAYAINLEKVRESNQPSAQKITR